MRYLELWRHSIRTTPNVHLSQEGVELARRVGMGMGPFCRVVSSPSPRTFETAIAMGFAVDEHYTPVDFDKSEWEALGQMLPDGTPFSEVSRVFRDDPLGRRFAEALRSQWTQYMIETPQDGSVLVVTHGGYIEYSAVACLPDADHASWGPALGRCEGIRLGFDGSEFTNGKIIVTEAENNS